MNPPERLDEPELLDAIVLLRAHIARDEATLLQVMTLVDPFALFATTVGLLVDRLLAESWPGGLEALDDHLGRLQAGDRP